MTPENADVLLAKADLLATPGLPGSGRQRYAAAMTLYRRGLLSHEVLEVFRICSPSDRDDPRQLLHSRGLKLDLEALGVPEIAIHRLIAEIDQYLAGRSGPGIAEVRSLTARWRNAESISSSSGQNAVVDAHLEAALACLGPEYPTLAERIRSAAPHLNWVTYDSYPHEEIGEPFRTGHAFASLIGDEAPIAAEDFDMGLFLIAPGVLYRDHGHPAPELYAPLTGPHGWRFGVGAPLIVKPAHVPVWNLPDEPHLTKVGKVPFLCIFAWTRDVNLPAYVIPAQDWADLDAMTIEE